VFPYVLFLYLFLNFSHLTYLGQILTVLTLAALNISDSFTEVYNRIFLVVVYNRGGPHCGQSSQRFHSHTHSPHKVLPSNILHHSHLITSALSESYGLTGGVVCSPHNTFEQRNDASHWYGVNPNQQGGPHPNFKWATEPECFQRATMHESVNSRSAP
jgi:hypothetical protein